MNVDSITRVQELVRNHTEIPGSPTFYTATFALAMNKSRYEALPADLKAAIALVAKYENAA